MNRNYFILTVIMFLLAAGTFLLPKREIQKQIDPEKLLWEIIQPTRYVSTDQVAKMIINKDPSLEIIDVRPAKEYNKFSLPNAVNVPIDSLLSENSRGYFGIPGIKIVFISNDDIKADQEWTLAKRLGYTDMYVMKGGLNRWMETIIQPKEPGEEAPSTAFEQYEFRKGARLYFTGAKTETASSSKKLKKVVVRRKKKAAVAAGGC
jgi:rhodanese-related sulfurtransferase